MIEKVATIFVALSTLVIISCDGSREFAPIARITVSRLDGVASVQLSNATATVRDSTRRQTRVVFPETLQNRSPTIDGIKYLGLHAEGGGDHIDVCAARQQNANDAVTVIIDTSISILLEVVFEEKEKTTEKPAVHNVVRRNVEAGKHTVVVRRPTPTTPTNQPNCPGPTSLHNRDG